MNDHKCSDWVNHEEDVLCGKCKETPDKYLNTESDFSNCSFPDCGCDGARLCMAKEGASDDALKHNVENMYSGKSKRQIVARIGLIGFVRDKEKEGK